jgi:hypothetical protein
MLVPAGLLCENNRFHDFGRWTYTYQPGAHVAGVGVQIRKNLFYSSYHVRAPANARARTLVETIPMLIFSFQMFGAAGCNSLWWE